MNNADRWKIYQCLWKKVGAQPAIDGEWALYFTARRCVLLTKSNKYIKRRQKRYIVGVNESYKDSKEFSAHGRCGTFILTCHLWLVFPLSATETKSGNGAGILDVFNFENIFIIAKFWNTWGKISKNTFVA